MNMTDTKVSVIGKISTNLKLAALNQILIKKEKE